VTKKTLVSIVAPFFNEEPAVAVFHDRLTQVVDAIPEFDFEFICVNDGSSDDTLVKLVELAESDVRIHVVDLSRNFGKEAALTAGLDEALGDAVIPIDADLQDPPELIPTLLARWREGFDVVVARRTDRQSDAFLKRKTAEFFYRFHNRISDTSVPENVGDFRLMDRAVVDALKKLPERRRFMKGLFAWVGFRTTTIDYARAPRAAGSTKFTGWRLWNFALEGITSFSTMPLRIWTYIGTSLAIVAFSYAAFIVIRTTIFGRDLPGYASLLTIVLFLGGIQLIGIGVIGEYIGRIYMESKGRPVYIVRRRIHKTG
jgi:glycosyltransferase involved in cell wall biosynthesis